MEERVAGRERTEAEEDVGKPRKRIGGSLKDGRRLRWMMAGRRHRKKGYLGGPKDEGCGGEHKVL